MTDQILEENLLRQKKKLGKDQQETYFNIKNYPGPRNTCDRLYTDIRDYSQQEK